MLILQRTTADDDWQLLANAADTDEADTMTQDRPGDFLLVDPDKLTVTGFRRVLTREPIAPA